MRLLKTIGSVDFTGQERAALNKLTVPLRDRCSFGRFTWLISQALTVTYVVGEHRLYLERNCRLPESGPQETAESRGACQFQGAEQSARVRPSGRTSAKVEAAFHGFHGSSPCKCQRLSTLRWDRLPPSRPSTKSGARAGGRRLSDRRLHRWLAGTSTSAASSHGAADLLGLNRAHICVRNQVEVDLLVEGEAHPAVRSPVAVRAGSAAGT